MDRSFFRKPQDLPEYSSACFWFWNDKIEEKEMLRQQKLMKENGLGMPMIHSRFGREIDYMGKEWMRLVRSSISCAEKIGQKIWLYDEDNWPSGTCSKTITKEEKFREHFLRMKEVKAEEWENFIKTISRDKILEIWTIDEKEELYWNAEDTIDRFPQKVSGKLAVVYWDIRPYDEGGRSCVDYLNPEAIQAFLQKTHETYKKEIGKELFSLVEGFFMDETRFYFCYPWTENYISEFKKRKGYSILGNLKSLFGNGVRTKAELDYLDVTAQLYKEATFWQVYNWCEKNRMFFTAHLLGEETLASQTRFEVDPMRQYEAMHIPGLDHLGNGIGSLDAKFVVSAARNYGKDRVCCEAFGASGWDTGIEDVIRISNWLIQQGVNMITAHGYYYSIRGERKNDFPPSYFYQWKDWDKMKAYNQMAARMMQMVSGGRHFGNILVYYPIETFWMHNRPDPWEKTGFGENGSQIRSKRAAEIDRDYQIFLNMLSDLNIPYQIINNDSMKNYKIDGNEWVNILNGERHHTFVLLDTEILPQEAEKLINTFARAGGRIFSYGSAQILKDISEFSSIKELIDACSKIMDLEIDILEGTDHCQHNMLSYPSHLIDPYLHDGEDLYGVGISRYDKDGCRIYNFTNYNLKEEKMKVLVRNAERVEIWNPETGEENLQEGICISFRIPPNRTRYIVAK